jgi:hypothetical protein
MHQEKNQGLPIFEYTAIVAAPNPVVVQENIYQATAKQLGWYREVVLRRL